MQLDKGERSILSYFGSSTKARAAADELEKAGLVPEPGSIQVDRISRYAAETNADYDPPLSSAMTLSGLTLYSDDSGPGGPNPLLAADGSASGLGRSNQDIAVRSFMLTLVTSSENIAQAVKIIKENGGSV